MPMHDWTRATAGTYHDFHWKWIAAISNDLNARLLPPGFFAMAEQIFGGPAPDVVTLHDWPDAPAVGADARGAVATLPEPTAPAVAESIVQANQHYLRKKSQIAIKHEVGHVLSVIELVSPGNKHSRIEIDRLQKKAAELIHSGVHLLVVDPFPPSPRDITLPLSDAYEQVWSVLPQPIRRIVE